MGTIQLFNDIEEHINVRYGSTTKHCDDVA